MSYSHCLPPPPPHVASCCNLRVALYCSTPHALLQPARRALLPCASRPAAANASRPDALRVAPCCPARRALLQPARRALLPHTRLAATTAAAATRATAAAGGGAAGSAGSAAGAGGAGGATGSAGGAAGAGCATGSAGGAGPTTDRHCMSWPLSWQLQGLGVDSGGHCLSRTTPTLCSFASAFFSEPVQVVEALVFYVLHRGGSRVSRRPSPLRCSCGTGPSSAEALHTFTLDSGASRCFFRDCTTLTPLAAPIPVSLADPTRGPVVARASTVLPCSAVPCGSLSGLHLPTFSTNLVSNAAIQDVWVDTIIPVGQRVAIFTCSRTGHHLATFTQRPGSSVYTMTTASTQVAEAGQVAVSSQVSASGQLAASCSCRVP
ncbi:unnamed protein product [Closterium sp. NIES-54]